ncbi:unknown [Bacteroides sp. CAG:633]|nr:unknown [Bacteroides sp. CAG:633]
MNVIPPILRLRCTQPASVTCLLTSEIRSSPQVCDLYILYKDFKNQIFQFKICLFSTSKNSCKNSENYSNVKQTGTVF